MQRETRSAPKKPKRNYWKWICITLIAVLLLSAGWVYVAVFKLSPQEEPTPTLISNKSTVEFQTSTTKADLNQLISSYIEDFSKDQEIGYKVFVADNVNFTAEAKIFGEPVELHLKFSPKVVDNGNVELTLKDMSAGALPLPVSYVMNYVNKNFKFPDWVTIIPKKEKIYLSLDKLKLQGDTKVRADTLNLKKDDISFTLLVPVK
ncbi:YpmS family protein [Listeria cossartiae subsp. cayugensis]|uniref:YpmS family protein n=1 Tax=Listeria TaxID=1637 RepID=UPI00188869F8|nr:MULTISPECIES: YpmS family protein [Listeria]MBF2478376.1 YpmS family protein [Listeria marthii]MBF2495009.1 YpmS family protein [Listeria marthii]MDT0000187.1 YpmS family protein [Listeria cossartiae subsp. cayugensis]MDT0008725.1 YpmS family protein [Listeria cossartiae subsp. cayugensis]MDT0014336.1 YpmS family protein [Listeria cossartiae subsp. cayugensis]